MTDDSKFVLRWEIDNATATFATDKAESGVFNEGGFKWTIRFQRKIENRDFIKIFLTCDHEGTGEWKCDVDAEFNIVHRTGRSGLLIDDLTFDNDNRVHPFNNALSITHILSTTYGFNVGDKVVFEIHAELTNCIIPPNIDPITPKIDLSKFCSPNKMGNVTLLIEDKKLQVSKEYLAIHSPVFAAMFFKEFAEKDEEEVVINDVVYKEFLDLLLLMFSRCAKVTDHTVVHILKLADQFIMEDIKSDAETHLLASKKFNSAEKLQIADMYRLEKLRDHCLNAYTAREIGSLKSTPQYATFSDGLKSVICDRLMDLIKTFY